MKNSAKKNLSLVLLLINKMPELHSKNCFRRHFFGIDAFIFLQDVSLKYF